MKNKTQEILDLLESREDLLVHFDSKVDFKKAEKVIDKSDYSLSDTHGQTMAFEEDNLDALEMELDKLFSKNKIKGYTFEAGNL